MPANFTNDGLHDLTAVANDLRVTGYLWVIDDTGVDVEQIVGAVLHAIWIRLGADRCVMGRSSRFTREAQEDELFTAIAGMVDAARDEGWVNEE